jgi:citronellol/citronellal dehydrogenase
MSAGSAAAESALSGRTIVMSGGSRGIGLAIAVAAARHGANAVLLAKTDKPHPRLPGTVHTAVGPEAVAGARSPQIMADAAMEILARPPATCTGQTLVDVDVLAGAGIRDLSGYGGGDAPTLDLYIDPPSTTNSAGGNPT